MKKENSIGKLFLATSLLLLIIGLIGGVFASLSYIIPGLWKDSIGFMQLRPIHVSAIMFFILLGGSGCVFSGLFFIDAVRISKPIATIQFLLWVIALIGIFYSYLHNEFGGREYWEFPPIYALPIALAWLLFIFNFFKVVLVQKSWPVYFWMWMTGLIFFLFTFFENYLWLFPYFRDHFIKDMTIQWKANGSLVGSYNQLIYGTAFFLMEKISGDKTLAKSKLAFGMYFLGLTNLMFNWAHHIYTLPTESHIRFVGYVVSMTEWIFFAKIIYNWNKTVIEVQKNFHYSPYRFLIAADVWVFLNMGLAIFMSVPALNLYTHGTHVTVAHAMGSTIGINTMVILAACFEFFSGKCTTFSTRSRWLRISYWVTQITLLVFWLTMIVIGFKKGIWQMDKLAQPFNIMMDGMRFWFYLFVVSGSVLMVSIGIQSIILLRSYIVCLFKKELP